MSDEKAYAGRQYIAQLREGCDHGIGDGGSIAQDEKNDQGNQSYGRNDDCLERMIGGRGNSAQVGSAGEHFVGGQVGKSDFIPHGRRCGSVGLCCGLCCGLRNCRDHVAAR